MDDDFTTNIVQFASMVTPIYGELGMIGGRVRKGLEADVEERRER